MSIPESSLPESWVRKVFATMRATYGAAFDRQWQCPAGADPAEHAVEMIAHWARELRGYQQSPSAIAHALDNLPATPPNLVEFRALCRSAPQYTQRQLEAPKVPPERVAEALASISRPIQQHNDRQWAHNLKAREQRDPKGLTMAQRWMWREALGENRSAA